MLILTAYGYSVGVLLNCIFLTRAIQERYLQMGFGEAQMLDKVLYEEEVRRLVFTFEQQFHYGVFFAYMRLREQEIRNVMWIAECIAQDQKNRINDGIVLIF